MKRIILSALAAITVLSCTKGSYDGDGTPDGLPGWYGCKIEDASAFKDASEAIMSLSLFTAGRYSGRVSGQSYVLQRSDYFDESGEYKPKLYNTTPDYSMDIESYANFIQIVDNNTLIKYSAQLFLAGSSSTKGKKVLYRFNAGPVFGELVYCATSDGQFYTYASDGSKIITSDGDIFTVSGKMLIRDGDSVSQAYNKFNPDHVYGDSSVDENYIEACKGVNGWISVSERDYYIAYLNVPDIVVTPIVNRVSGTFGGKNAKYGWEIILNIVSDKENKIDKVFSDAELPGSSAYSALSWDADGLAETSVFEKTLQAQYEEYLNGTLSNDERAGFEALVVYVSQDRIKARNNAHAWIRFFAEVNGKRYYVKMIQWSYKNGAEEYDNTTNNLSKPQV